MPGPTSSRIRLLGRMHQTQNGSGRKRGEEVMGGGTKRKERKEDWTRGSKHEGD